MKRGAIERREHARKLDELGRRVQFAIERIGSLERAAKTARISPRQLGRIARGEAEPRALTMARLARAAREDLHWLLVGMPPQSRRISVKAVEMLTWATLHASEFELDLEFDERSGELIPGTKLRALWQARPR